jgi:hypothetical protein
MMTRQCPKCDSNITKKVFSKQKDTLVSLCLNCCFKGDSLFTEIEEIRGVNVGR